MRTEEVRKKYFGLGGLKQPRQNTILLYRHDKPMQRTNLERTPLSFVLFESPFTSISTVRRGHPSPVSLVAVQLSGGDEKSFLL
jgi:hypothetical protein